MHIIDREVFLWALKKKGFCSVGELAKSLGMHRNTIHYYLSGSHGVFPENLEKIIKALNLKPHDILLEKSDSQIPQEKIAPLIDKLHVEFPNVAFVMFGSRAKGKTQKYSDWDIGVFAEPELTHDVYRKIVMRKNDLIEDFPFFVDIVNLNRADIQFLRNIAKHWLFLAGSLSAWLGLQRRLN